MACISFYEKNLQCWPFNRTGLLSCMHRPVQPKSLSCWGEVSNSLIFQQGHNLANIQVQLQYVYIHLNLKLWEKHKAAAEN